MGNQIPGQLSIDDLLRNKKNGSCTECICRNCLYWWSSRCPHGTCYDDYRAKSDPYDKAHPDKPLRTAWSNWNKPGEQAHWCRGGILYPANYCEHFEKYTGSTIEDCVLAPIQIFQNGFDCEWMTDTGCERMAAAKNLIIQAIEEGEDIEMCREQCCKGCTKTCGFRCMAIKGG